MADYRIAPWGEAHAETLNAYAMAQYAEAHRDTRKRHDAFTIGDFLLYLGEPRARGEGVQLTPEQYLAAVIGRPGVKDKRKRKRKKKRRA